MRIAIVAPLVSQLADPPLGGAQTVVADLAGGLGARGHQVDVYAATGSHVAGARMVETGVDASTLAATRFRSGARQQEVGGREAFQRVFGMIRAESYDVVHNHAFDPAAVAAAGSLGSPTVHTLHLPLDEAMAAALRTVLGAGRPPLVAAVSNAQAEAWRGAIRVDAVIHNGVPTRLIPWTPRPGRGLVFAGRLSPEKGAREAIEIALAAEIEIDVYGDSYDADYALKVVAPLGRRAGVRLHPPLHRAALWHRLVAASAVLCPAMWEEPFGLIAAEAQATGTPVVGFRSGGLAEVVNEGSTGYLVTPGDVPAAARALGAVPDLSRPACRHHATSALDLEPMLDAHERLYRRAGNQVERRAPAGKDG